MQPQDISPSLQGKANKQKVPGTTLIPSYKNKNTSRCTVLLKRIWGKDCWYVLLCVLYTIYLWPKKKSNAVAKLRDILNSNKWMTIIVDTVQELKQQ